MDAEYIMIKDAKNEYWPKKIFPVFYSNDQDIVYLLARNQIKDSIIIQNPYSYWNLINNEMTSKLALLTLMFEGNDYIKGLIGISSDVLITKQLKHEYDIIEYTKTLKPYKKNMEQHILEQHKEDILSFNKTIDLYTNLSGEFYDSDIKFTEILFVDYIKLY
jgi:hypothetical protein